MIIGYDWKKKCYYVETRPGRINDNTVEPEKAYFSSEPKITKYWTEHHEHPDGMEYISYCAIEADGKAITVKSFTWYPNVREGYKHTEYWEVIERPWKNERQGMVVMSQMQGQ